MRIVDVVVNYTLRQYRNDHHLVQSTDVVVDPVRNVVAAYRIANLLTFADAYNAHRNTTDLVDE